MNDSTNRSMTEDPLPASLQQAVTATNMLVPSHESESRVMETLLRVPSVQESAQQQQTPAERITRERRSARRQINLRRLFGVVAIPVALCLCLLIPCDFSIKVAGAMHPKERREVFADVMGDVVEISEGVGSIVEKGDTLLVLRNTELETRASQLEGQLLFNISRKRLLERQVQTMSEEPRAEITQQLVKQLVNQLGDLSSEIEVLEKEQALLNTQIDALTIKSPMSGAILDHQLQRNLMNRPVNRGDKLMTIGKLDGDWVVEVDLSQDEMKYLSASPPDEDGTYPVEFIVMSHPDRRLKGKLSEQGNFFGQQFSRWVVNVDAEQLERWNSENLKGGREPVPGDGVAVRVNCGQRPCGYVWFRKLRRFVERS